MRLRSLDTGGGGFMQPIQGIVCICRVPWRTLNFAPTLRRAFWNDDSPQCSLVRRHFAWRPAWVLRGLAGVFFLVVIVVIVVISDGPDGAADQARPRFPLEIPFNFAQRSIARYRGPCPEGRGDHASEPLHPCLAGKFCAVP